MGVDAYIILAEAVGLGLLIGVERYRDRGPDEKRIAGARTFAIFSVLGAVCGLIGEPLYTALTFSAMVLVIAIGYIRESAEGPGMTTEVTALLTFWLGYLLHTHEALSASIAIVVVILLASKRALHDFVRESISDIEFYDTLKFLAVVIVVLPILPDRQMGPHEFFNPTRVWYLVIAVSTINYSGYVFIRTLGGKRGLELSAVTGGIVSTTAVTLALAERARKVPEHARLFGVSAVMANAVQLPRLLVLIALVDTTFARSMAVPLLAAAAVGMGGALLLANYKRVWDDPPEVNILLQNPYSLREALKFAAFLLVILFASRAATNVLGVEGLLLTSGIAGLGDASAITISAARLTATSDIGIGHAAVAVWLAIAANAAAKWVLAVTRCGKSLAFWLGGGFLTMLAIGIGLTFVFVPLP